MNADEFAHRLHHLTADDIERVAMAVRAEVATAEGELAWWRATIEVTEVLRRQHCSRQAGLAAHRAATAVVEAARAVGYAGDEHRDEVTAVARAAAEAARLLVAERAGAGTVTGGQPLVHPWQRIDVDTSPNAAA